MRCDNHHHSVTLVGKGKAKVLLFASSDEEEEEEWRFGPMYAAQPTQGIRTEEVGCSCSVSSRRIEAMRSIGFGSKASCGSGESQCLQVVKRRCGDYISEGSIRNSQGGEM